MLQVENLRFSYVPGQDIMKDVTFTIGSGEFITLGGRNGCGKTTVTRLLVGLEIPVEGKISYDGRDITHMPTSERGRFYWLCISTTRSSNVPPNRGRRGGIWA